MSKKPSRDLERENAILSSNVRMDGKGEDPVVKAVLSEEFATKMDNQEVLDVALGLQQLIKGQNSILENQATQAEELAKLRARVDKYDEDAKKWDDDKDKFLEDVYKKADSLRISDPMKRASFEGKEGVKIENAVSAARVKHATNRLEFEQQLALMPKVTVTSAGRIEKTDAGGQLTARIVPEIIRIKHKVWILKPGVPTEVPLIVAQQMEHRQRIQDEGNERKKALMLDDGIMTAKNEMGRVAQSWQNINNEYKVGTDPMPSH